MAPQGGRGGCLRSPRAWILFIESMSAFRSWSSLSQSLRDIACMFSHSLVSNTATSMEPPGSSVHGISQARIFKCVAVSSSRGSSWPRDWTHISGSCIGRQILYHWSNWQAPQPTIAAAAAAKSLQSCLTLCDSIDSSPPGSPIPGILQARALEWVAITFSSAWKWKMKVKLLGGVWLFATPWTAAYQAPPSMGFSRQEDWSGLGSSK